MHFNNLLLLSVSLTAAQGYVAPRNGGSSNSLLSLFKIRSSSPGSSSGSSSCQRDDCYNDIFSRNDNGFCRQFNSPSSCNLPSDLSKYSSKKDSVRSACNCYLQQSPSTSSAPRTSPTSGPSSCVKDSCYNDIFDRNDNGFCREFNSPSSCNLPSDLSKYSSKKDSVRSACNCYLQHQSTQAPTSTHAQPTSTSAPSCVQDDCYNDIFNRVDNGFCRQYNSPSSCNLPSDLSKYSSKKDSVRSACNCYLQHQSTQTNGPTTATHSITTNGPSQSAHTVTVTGPESDYTVTVSRSQPAHTVTVSGASQPAHTVTVSGPSQPAHTVTVSGASQPAHTVTVSGSSQPAHTITVSAPATKTCPAASTVKETCTVTKTQSFTAQATCSSQSASVITKTCTVTKTVTGNGPSSMHSTTHTSTHATSTH